jgi:hypothetical protein
MKADTECAPRTCGYDTLYGGGVATDLSTYPGSPDHPAGRYQETYTNYNEFAPQLGLSDFMPHTQDLIAVQLMVNDGAAGHLLSGDFDSALLGLSHTWASLPQGPGGFDFGYYDRPAYNNQKAQSYSSVSGAYSNHLTYRTLDQPVLQFDDVR